MAASAFTTLPARSNSQVGRARPGVGQVGAGQIGRAAQQLGQGGGEVLQRDLAGLAAGHGLGLGVGFDGSIDGDLMEGLGQLALNAAHEFLGQLGEGGLVGGELDVPGGLGGLAGVLGVPGGVHILGDHEGGRGSSPWLRG